MTTLAITLEATESGNTRALVLARDDSTGYKHVEDIFEADDANIDAMWHLIADKYPTLTHVSVNGVFIDADCLTVREAAEAAFA